MHKPVKFSTIFIDPVNPWQRHYVAPSVGYDGFTPSTKVLSFKGYVDGAGQAAPNFPAAT